MRSKNLFFIVFLIGFYLQGSSQHNNFELPLSINDDGAAPDNSALLDVQSTQKGVLIPRMSSSERNAIPTPATGLMVFDNNTTSFWYYDGISWVEVGGEASLLRDIDGDTYVSAGGNVDRDEVTITIKNRPLLKFKENNDGVFIADLGQSNFSNTVYGRNSGHNIDSSRVNFEGFSNTFFGFSSGALNTCLLYTSDAADE